MPSNTLQFKLDFIHEFQSLGIHKIHTGKDLVCTAIENPILKLLNMYYDLGLQNHENTVLEKRKLETVSLRRLEIILRDSENRKRSLGEYT